MASTDTAEAEDIAVDEEEDDGDDLSGIGDLEEFEILDEVEGDDEPMDQDSGDSTSGETTETSSKEHSVESSFQKSVSQPQFAEADSGMRTEGTESGGSFASATSTVSTPAAKTNTVTKAFPSVVKKSPSMAKTTPKAAKKTPVVVKKTTLVIRKKKGTPATTKTPDGTKKPAVAVKKTVGGKATPASVKTTPKCVKATPTALKATPASAKKTPTSEKKIPTAVKAVSTIAKTTPTEVKTPTPVKTTSTTVKPILTSVKTSTAAKTPMAAKAPTAAKATPTATKTPTPAKTAPTTVKTPTSAKTPTVTKTTPTRVQTTPTSVKNSTATLKTTITSAAGETSATVVKTTPITPNTASESTVTTSIASKTTPKTDKTTPTALKATPRTAKTTPVAAKIIPVAVKATSVAAKNRPSLNKTSVKANKTPAATNTPVVTNSTQVEVLKTPVSVEVIPAAVKATAGEKTAKSAETTPDPPQKTAVNIKHAPVKTASSATKTTPRAVMPAASKATSSATKAAETPSLCIKTLPAAANMNPATVKTTPVGGKTSSVVAKTTLTVVKTTLAAAKTTSTAAKTTKTVVKMTPKSATTTPTANKKTLLGGKTTTVDHVAIPQMISTTPEPMKTNTVTSKKLSVGTDVTDVADTTLVTGESDDVSTETTSVVAKIPACTAIETSSTTIPAPICTTTVGAKTVATTPVSEHAVSLSDTTDSKSTITPANNPPPADVSAAVKVVETFPEASTKVTPSVMKSAHPGATNVTVPLSKSGSVSEAMNFVTKRVTIALTKLTPAEINANLSAKGTNLSTPNVRPVATKTIQSDTSPATATPIPLSTCSSSTDVPAPDTKPVGVFEAPTTRVSAVSSFPEAVPKAQTSGKVVPKSVPIKKVPKPESNTLSVKSQSTGDLSAKIKSPTIQKATSTQSVPATVSKASLVGKSVPVKKAFVKPATVPVKTVKNPIQSQPDSAKMAPYTQKQMSPKLNANTPVGKSMGGMPEKETTVKASPTSKRPGLKTVVTKRVVQRQSKETMTEFGLGQATSTQTPKHMLHESANDGETATAPWVAERVAGKQERQLINRLKTVMLHPVQVEDLADPALQPFILNCHCLSARFLSSQKGVQKKGHLEIRYFTEADATQYVEDMKGLKLASGKYLTAKILGQCGPWDGTLDDWQRKNIEQQQGLEEARCVFVHNLPADTQEDMLRLLFPEVVNISLHLPKEEDKKATGNAVLEFRSPEEAEVVTSNSKKYETKIGEHTVTLTLIVKRSPKTEDVESPSEKSPVKKAEKAENKRTADARDNTSQVSPRKKAKSEKDKDEMHYKGTDIRQFLLHWCYAHDMVPQYSFKSWGPSHRLRFRCEAKVAKVDYVARGTGTSKKNAQYKCAYDFAKHLIREGKVKDSSVKRCEQELVSLGLIPAPIQARTKDKQHQDSPAEKGDKKEDKDRTRSSLLGKRQSRERERRSREPEKQHSSVERSSEQTPQTARSLSPQRICNESTEDEDQNIQALKSEITKQLAELQEGRVSDPDKLTELAQKLQSVNEAKQKASHKPTAGREQYTVPVGLRTDASGSDHNKDRGYHRTERRDQEKDVPLQRRNKPDEGKNGVDQRGGAPDNRRDSHDNRTDTPDNQKDTPDNRRDTPDNRRDILDNRRDTPDNRRDTQDHRKGTPDHRRNIPDNKRGTLGNKKDMPDHRRNMQNNKRDTFDQKKDVWDQRRDVPGNKRDTFDKRRGIPDHRRNTPDHRRNTPDHRRNTPDHRSNTTDLRRDTTDHSRDTLEHRRDTSGHIKPTADKRRHTPERNRDLSDRSRPMPLRKAATPEKEKGFTRKVDILGKSYDHDKKVSDRDTSDRKRNIPNPEEISLDSKGDDYYDPIALTTIKKARVESPPRGSKEMSHLLHLADMVQQNFGKELAQNPIPQQIGVLNQQDFNTVPRSFPSQMTSSSPQDVNRGVAPTTFLQQVSSLGQQDYSRGVAQNTFPLQMANVYQKGSNTDVARGAIAEQMRSVGQQVFSRNLSEDMNPQQMGQQSVRGDVHLPPSTFSQQMLGMDHERLKRDISQRTITQPISGMGGEEFNRELNRGAIQQISGMGHQDFSRDLSHSSFSQLPPIHFSPHTNAMGQNTISQGMESSKQQHFVGHYHESSIGDQIKSVRQQEIARHHSPTVNVQQIEILGQQDFMSSSRSIASQHISDMSRSMPSTGVSVTSQGLYGVGSQPHTVTASQRYLISTTEQSSWPLREQSQSEMSPILAADPEVLKAQLINRLRQFQEGHLRDDSNILTQLAQQLLTVQRQEELELADNSSQQEGPRAGTSSSDTATSMTETAAGQSIHVQQPLGPKVDHSVIRENLLLRLQTAGITSGTINSLVKGLKTVQQEEKNASHSSPSYPVRAADQSEYNRSRQAESKLSKSQKTVKGIRFDLAKLKVQEQMKEKIQQIKQNQMALKMARKKALATQTFTFIPDRTAINPPRGILKKTKPQPEVKMSEARWTAQNTTYPQTQNSQSRIQALIQQNYMNVDQVKQEGSVAQEFKVPLSAVQRGRMRSEPGRNFSGPLVTTRVIGEGPGRPRRGAQVRFGFGNQSRSATSGKKPFCPSSLVDYPESP